MSKMSKRILSAFMVLIMVVAMLSTFTIATHAQTATDIEQLLENAYIIYGGWSDSEICGTSNLSLYFGGADYTVNPTTHKLFSNYEDAYEAAYGNADITPENYFDFIPTFVFGPGDYSGERIHVPTNANIYGANMGVSPNAPVDVKDRTISYLTDNGGWAANPAYSTANKTKLGTVLFSTRDKGSDGAWSDMPASGEGTKWQYLRDKAFEANPEAEINCVIDGIEIGKTINLSAYDYNVPLEYNGETIEKHVTGRKTNVYIKNSTTAITNNLVGAWNTTWHYQNFFFEDCRFDKNVSDFGTRYIDSLGFTDCYFASVSTDSAVMYTWINEAGTRYDTAKLTIDSSVFYNATTSMPFHINSDAFMDSVKKFDFELKNSVLYNAGTAAWGIFRLTNNEGRTLNVNVHDNLIYHTNSTNTLFNGNTSYVTSGKNTIHFNHNRIVSPTLSSPLPNMAYNILDTTDSSGKIIYGTNSLFDINFDDNFFGTSETATGKVIAYNENNYPKGNAEDSVWEWDWNDPSYYYDFACDYSNHGAKVTGATGGIAVVNGSDVSLYVASQGILTKDSFIYKDTDSEMTAVISKTDDFSSTVSSIDLSTVKSGDVYYLKSAYKNSTYAQKTEQVTKLTFFLNDAESFNQALVSGQVKVGDKVLSPDNTVVIASTDASILSTTDGDCFFGTFAGKNYKFFIDDVNVFANVQKSYSYTTVTGTTKTYDALDIDRFADKCTNGNIIITGGKTSARIMPAYPVTFYGANAGINPVNRNGLTATLSSEWNETGATVQTESIVMAYDIDGEVVFDGFTLCDKYWDDIRYGKEGALSVSFVNTVIDSPSVTNAMFYLGSPRAYNGSLTTFADVEFGKINKDSFTLKNCYAKQLGDNQIVDENICPNLTIDNFHIDNQAAAKHRDLIGFLKVGLYNKNNNITIKNSSFINSVAQYYPVLQYQGFRNNPEILIDDSYDINIKFNNNIVYNSGSIETIFYVASGQMSSFEVTGNTFVSTDKSRKLMTFIGDWSHAENCQLTDNVTISDNSFVGFDADALACDIGMGNNNPKLTKCFVTNDASALSNQKAFIGGHVPGVTYGDIYLNFDRSALLSDYSLKAVEVSGGRATFDNTSATVDIELSGTGDVTFVNKNSNAVGKLSKEITGAGSYTYTITMNGMSRDYTVNVTTSDYSGYTRISTAQEFSNIRNNPSGKYLLTDDITLAAGFSPISDFTGVLDGGFYSVKGVNFAHSSSSNMTVGIFRNCSGTIKNLSVYGNIKVTTSATAYVGSIVGSGTATLTDCANYCTITVSAKNAYVGGVAGSLNSAVGCYNAGDINVTATGYAIASGITTDAVTVSKCYNAGKVTSSDDACGVSAYGNIIDCYNAGVVSAGAFASGIALDANVENCYSVAFINGKTAGYGITQNGSAINCYYAKYTADGYGKAIERDALSDMASYVGFDFGSIWQMSDDEKYPLPVLASVTNVASADAAENNGSPFSPFLITSKADFEAIRNYKGGYFRLEKDIDLGEIAPIDNFEGYFDGNGKKLTVNITSDGKYVGLFAKNSGVIENLGVDGSVVSTAKDAYVGAIAGNSSGEIYGCYNNATVIASTGSYVGGIAGVGDSVKLCHNTGDINGGDVAGAIAGHGKAENCYNTANVTSANYAGGIVGVGSASKCYSLGKVSGKNAGGIAGKCNEKDVVADCYYLNTTASNGYGVACTPADFYQIDSYDGFDFANAWKMSDDTAYPFAVLADFANTAKYTDESCGFAGGNGSAFAPFLVQNEAQLNSIRNYPKAYFKLINDITMSDNSFAPIENFEGELDGFGFTVKNLHINTNGNGAFITVNNGTVKNLGIAGCEVTVSGEGRVIGAPLVCKNLGTISNCYTEGSVSVSSTAPAYASGFAGENGGSIDNCFSAVTVNSNYYAVGFATYNTGSVTNCYSVSTLCSEQNLGIASFALANSGTLKSAFAIEAKNVGGVGTVKKLSALKLKSTYVGFDFTGVWQMGGTNYPFPVLKNVANGIDVMSGGNEAEFGGGDGSAVNPFIVANASHFANVSKYPTRYFVQTADIDMDGIEYTPVAEFYGVYDGANKKISNVKVDTQNGTAGLFAVNYGVISGINLENAYINVNTADELVYAGGIVGHNYSGSVSGCKVSADIIVKASYNAYVGGIVGHNYGKAISGCEFDGKVDVNVAGTAYAGGIAGYSKTSVGGSVWGAVATAGAATNYLGGIVGLCDGSVSGENYALVYSANGGGYIGGTVGKNADSDGVMINHGAVVSLESEAVVVMGGIVGYTTGNINKAYNTGAVSSASDKSVVGGIAGMLDGKLTNAFNTATLTGKTVGGLVGQNTGAVSTSYSLTGDKGDDHGTYTNCLFGSSCTTSQSAYTGFDFTNTWTTSGASEYTYPELNGYNVVNTPASVTIGALKSEIAFADVTKDPATFDVTYKFGTSETVSTDNYDIIGLDCHVIGEQNVTVAFGGLVAGQQTVSVLCPHEYDGDCDDECNVCHEKREAAAHSSQAGYDETNHFYKCKNCGFTFNVKAHIYDNDCDTTCSGCKYVRVTEHDYATSFDSENHYSECTSCGDTLNAQPHVFDNACDTDCNVCEYTRTTSHSYQAGYDETSHFYKCKHCGFKFNEKAHIFDNDCDTSCSGCKYVREIKHNHEMLYNDTTHYGVCSVCGDTTASQAHVFDNACDPDCNVCAYTRTTSHSYQAGYDEVNHFYMCKHCGITFNEKAHIFDNDCDSSCSGCKYVRVPLHNWSEWIYNEDATEKADGTETRTCASCGASETRIKEGTKLPAGWNDPTYRPDEHMPFLTLNESGNAVVLNQNKSWATRVYWGNIGEEYFDYKWFDDDLRLPAGTDYFADYTPREGEVYNFTKPGWYRFIVKAIRTGTTAEDYTYSELLFEFYYDGSVAPTVPTITELENNQVRINTNGSPVKKFYYGNIGSVNTPYSWFNSFWGTALATKTYTGVFDTRDGRIITLQTAGYYNIVIVLNDGTEYVYTTYAAQNAPIIKKVDGKAQAIVDIDCLKGNVGTKATLNRIYYGYVGTTDKELTTYDQIKANTTGFTGDSAATQGKTYNLKNKGYYKFLVLATLSNGKAVELVYTVYNS